MARALAAAALCIGLALASVGGANAQPRIVGGAPASQPWPFFAYLDIYGNIPGPECGGSLIAPRVILTAAHCVTFDGTTVPVLPTSVTATLGKTRISDAGGTSIQSSSIAVHEDYEPQTGTSNRPRYDLAVVRLAQPAPQQPISIVGRDDLGLWDPGTTATIIGHGDTSQMGASSDELLQAEVPIVEDGTCQSSYGVLFDGGVMVCAGFAAGGVDTCQGDSGGPFIVPYGTSNRLAGIVSWGDGCAQPDKYGVYTRIGTSELRRWIRAQIGTTQVGLANPGFEAPLNAATDWEAVQVLPDGTSTQAACTEDQRGVCVISVDAFTDTDAGRNYEISPVDGASMIRLGGPFSSRNQNQPLDRYILKQTFIVDPTDPTIDLNYNAFLYDYTGFDELRLRVSVTDEDGDVLFSRTQGAFGPGGDTTLKTTGWVGNRIDLSAYAGQAVTLRVDSGGTLDNLYGFWVYLDAGELPAPAVGSPTVTPPVSPSGAPVAVQVNQNGSQTYFTVAASEVGQFPPGGGFSACLPLSLSVPITAGAGTVGTPQMLLGSQTVPLEDPDENGIFTFVAGSTLCAANGPLFLDYDLTENGLTQHFVVPIGGVSLIDPQGVVYDAAGYAAALALAGVDPACDEAVEACRTAKDSARASSALPGATVRLQREGVGGFIDVLSGDPGISPNANPQVTGASGRFQWDVSAGAYRVVVLRSGYVTVTSRTVQIPPPVLDLHVGMERARPTAAFDRPATVVEGHAAALTSTSTGPGFGGTIASFAWSSPDGTVTDPTSPTATVRFAAPGTRSVTLTVTDDDGDISTLTQQIAVSSTLPSAAFDFAPAEPVVGSPVTLTSQSSALAGVDQIVAQRWSTDGGAFDDGAGPSVTFTPTAAGIAMLRLEVTDEDGDVAIATRQIEVRAAAVTPPVVTPQPPVVTQQPLVVTPPTMIARKRVNLSIVIRRGSRTARFTLICESPAGTWGGRVGACARLRRAAGRATLAPIRSEVRNLVAISVARLTITGTLDGKRVSITIPPRGSSTRRVRFRALRTMLGAQAYNAAVARLAPRRR